LRVEKIEEDVAYLKEYLSYGQERCLGGVEILLSKREGLLRFVAMPPHGLPSGEAVLSRVPRSL
jgi:hypothetical protein